MLIMTIIYLCKKYDVVGWLKKRATVVKVSYAVSEVKSPEFNR
jgi:hypothetical protein